MPSPSPIIQAFDSALSAWKLVEALSVDAKAQMEMLDSIDGQIGGRAPFDDTELRNDGHAEMGNLNFRGARLRVRRAFRRSLDLLISTPQAVRVRFKEWPELTTREPAQMALAQAFTRYMRSCKVMRTRRHRLRECVRVGAGFAYFPDPLNPTPRFLSRASVLLPIDAKENPSEWTVAVVHDSLNPLAILRILDSGDAKWNRTALLKAVHLCHNRGAQYDERAFDEEKAANTEKRLRLNSVGSAYGEMPSTVGISHVYARSASGKVDHYVVAREGKLTDFLFTSPDEAECFSDVLYPMYYTEEPNLYWDIEGLGHDIYNAEMLRDRSVNATFDYADLALRPVVKMASRRNAVLPRVDRFTLIDTADEISFDAMQQDISRPLALTQFLDRGLDSTVTGAASPSSAMSQQPISAAEARVQDISVDEQQTVAADFLYEAENELLEVIAERLLAWKPSEIAPDDYADEFREEVRALPYFDAKLFKPENMEVTVYRAIGAGSGRDRRMALGTLFQARGALSPIGQNRLVRDFVTELAGPDYADRYAPLVDERNTPLAAAQHAHLENAVFDSGRPLPTPVDDPHALHATVHLQFLLDTVKRGMAAEEQRAQFNSQAMLATLSVGLQHTAVHVDLFTAAANTQELKQQGDAFVSAVSQITNYMQRLQKRVKDEQLAAAKEAERQQVAALQERAQLAQKMQAMEAEIVRLQTDVSVKRDKARADIAIAQQTAEAKLRLEADQAERKAARLI